MDAKTFYEQIAPKLDPGGFKLYFTAKRMTGFDLYGQFPYEDARGMFEMMNGHQLMRYLRISSMRFSGRSRLEPAMNGLSFSPSTAPRRHIGHSSRSCTQRSCTTTI